MALCLTIWSVQSISECFEWFAKHGSSVITPLGCPRARDLSQSGHLEHSLKQLLQDRGVHPTARLFEDTEGHELYHQLPQHVSDRPKSPSSHPNEAQTPICRTLVLASDTEKPSLSHRLRSYAAKMNGEGNIERCSILQAAMAAVAIYPEHTPIKIDGRMLISAYTASYANPSREAFDEASRIWQPGSVKVIISLGAGITPVPQPSSGIINLLFPKAFFISSMTHKVADTERVAEETRRDARSAHIRYSRFTLPGDLSKIKRCDWSATSRALIKKYTEVYLKEEEICCSIVNCSQYCLNPCAKQQREDLFSPTSQLPSAASDDNSPQFSDKDDVGEQRSVHSSHSQSSYDSYPSLFDTCSTHSEPGYVNEWTCHLNIHENWLTPCSKDSQAQGSQW